MVSRLKIAVLPLLSLAACSGGGADNKAVGMNVGDKSGGNAAAPAAGDAKVGQLISGRSDLGRANRLIANAGMTEMLNGVGPYTLFAPTDGAFDALGAERADALAGEAMRPQAVALLRAHIVPGTLTRRDMEAAIQAAGDRPATIKTMAGTMLNLSRDGDAIVLTAQDGARARLSGEEAIGGNGAVHAVDGLLRKAPG